jgi:hypothetical protein
MKNSCATLIALAFGTILSTVAAPPVIAQRRVSSPESTVESYCQAWGTADRAAREKLLAQVWTPDGIYTDPAPTVARGRTALSDEIATFLHKNPGSHFQCSTPQIHHQTMRFAWVLLRADGTQWTEGMDFGELSADGRIRRIVGFFGPLPTVRRKVPR